MSQIVVTVQKTDLSLHSWLPPF